MISTRTLQLWAEEDRLAAQTAIARQAARSRYQAQYEAAWDALHAMPPGERETARLALLLLDAPGCRSGTAAYSETLEWLAAHGIPDANRLFEHDRRHIARPVSVAAE